MQRAGAIKNVVSILRAVEGQFEGPGVQCRHGKDHCDSLTLGDWRRQLKSVDLLSVPAYPFAGLQFSALVSSIKSIENATLCSVDGRSQHRSIGSAVRASVEKVALRGLDLANLKSPKV